MHVGCTEPLQGTEHAGRAECGGAVLCVRMVYLRRCTGIRCRAMETTFRQQITTTLHLAFAHHGPGG